MQKKKSNITFQENCRYVFDPKNTQYRRNNHVCMYLHTNIPCSHEIDYFLDHIHLNGIQKSSKKTKCGCTMYIHILIMIQVLASIIPCFDLEGKFVKRKYKILKEIYLLT
jgi:hypothetical protein